MDGRYQRILRGRETLQRVSRAHSAKHDVDYRSLVDPRVRPLMYSRRLDSRYRTALPIFTNLGPSPDSLALASQDIETFRILAASRAYSSGSIVLAPAGAFICSPSFDYDGGT